MRRLRYLVATLAPQPSPRWAPGGGEYIDGGAENGGEGISVKTTVLEVPEAGCQNGNVPVQLGDYLVGQIDELEGL